MEGLEDVEGAEGLAFLKELGRTNPAEMHRRISELQDLPEDQVLAKLAEYDGRDISEHLPHKTTLPDPDLTFPDLMNFDPILDPHKAFDFPATRKNPHHGRVVIRNEPSIIQAEKERIARLLEIQKLEEGGAVQDAESSQYIFDELKPLGFNPDHKVEEKDVAFHLIPSKNVQRRFFRFPLISRRVTQQTGKGKIQRMYYLVVVGNGDGLVGYGEGKDEEAQRAMEKAYSEAVRNMDYVDRFEKRTVWTHMESKMGGTRIILRPRPVGFGLACNPNIHQVLKAAGIKDVSAKVWGSRNPINVIKTLCRMIHAGNAPLSFGNGIGGRGRKLDKGAGMKGKEVVERERGRKLVDLRTW